MPFARLIHHSSLISGSTIIILCLIAIRIVIGCVDLMLAFLAFIRIVCIGDLIIAVLAVNARIFPSRQLALARQLARSGVRAVYHVAGALFALFWKVLDFSCNPRLLNLSNSASILQHYRITRQLRTSRGFNIIFLR